MPQRKALVVGNWKQHGKLSDNARLLHLLVAAAPSTPLAVCVPFPYLAQTQQQLTGSTISWGAQNVSEYVQGAYTGEVSASMLAEFACRYVIVGHSERRSLFGESDQSIARKAAQALLLGLTPIVCVGETLAQRLAEQTHQVVATQLAAVIGQLGAQIKKIVLAYEPVWAIGTGQTASPAQAQDMHQFLRAQVAEIDAHSAANLQILYGGSVKPDNATDLSAMADIDGALVGGASLVAEDFLAIAQAFK